MSRSAKPKAASPGDYAVGYGRPPKEHQFRRGEVRNPRGRPPRQVPTFVEILEKVLNETRNIRIDGERLRKTNAEIIAMVLQEKAFQGDPAAGRLVAKLHKKFDRELTKEQNTVMSGVVHFGPDYYKIEEETFAEMRRRNPGGDESEQRGEAQQIALEKTGKFPEPVGPVVRVHRRHRRA